MEQDNVKIVQEMYAAFDRRDIATLLGHLSDDVEWMTPGSNAIPYAGRKQGRDQVARFFEQLAGSMVLEPFTIRKFVAQGDMVVVIGSYRGKTMPAGRDVQSDWAMTFELKNGKVVRFQEFTDTENLAQGFSSARAGAKA